MCSSWLSRGEAGFAVLAGFCGVNIPKTASSKPQTQHQWMRELERDEKVSSPRESSRTPLLAGPEEYFYSQRQHSIPQVTSEGLTIYLKRYRHWLCWLAHGNKLECRATFTTYVIISGQQSCEANRTAGVDAVLEGLPTGWPLAASGNVDFGRVPTTLIDKRSSLCQNNLCKQYGLL